MSNTVYTSGPEFTTMTLDFASGTLGAPTSPLSFGSPSPAIPVADMARPLVYRLPGDGTTGIDEIDTSANKATRLQTDPNSPAKLTTAAFCYSEGQRQDVRDRLYCGGSDGYLYTFYPNANGKGRHTEGTPYLIEKGTPVVDLAISGSGETVYALVQHAGGSKALRVLRIERDTTRSHVEFLELPSYDTIPNPTHVAVTDDGQYALVTGRSRDYCIIACGTSQKATYHGDFKCQLAGPPFLDGHEAYCFTGEEKAASGNATGVVEAVKIDLGTAKSASLAKFEVGFLAAIGAPGIIYKEFPKPFDLLALKRASPWKPVDMVNVTAEQKKYLDPGQPAASLIM
ncbi:hypothetical protein H8N00_07575 [Streptomyces sp. AC563]|uniref:hypothetical protein n=1 Tax=Streptomyces buecherae TaxID=2763006 RepID=UPI00164D04E7|nr:hypothetical protein [Streptomyces buecherae]MBC3988748.1 hypothetical protein [Streptomyces buecherae]